RMAWVVHDDGPRWGPLFLGVVGARDGATVLYRDLVSRRVPSPRGEEPVALLPRR
ncbi:MAG: hypothetical protein IRZ14_16460, partial [Chloroflexi bacterium]|nr:hypothetical protein [Chloroflexota bacterium]